MSVVVTVVDGGPALRGLLQSLTSQTVADRLEVIVPFDATIHGVSELAQDFPTVTFVPLGTLALHHDAASGAGRHELFDLRRAAGLAVAKASFIGMMEDRAHPEPDWAATMLRLHHELPHAVIGGPIATRATDTLNWAFHACDFTRYSPPITPGPRAFVSDVNLCYKRRALELTRPLWERIYNEATVHWDLVARGETLYLSAAPVVWHCSRYQGIGALVAERFAWGRLFGATRARHEPPARRLLQTLTAPLVVPLLWARLARVHASNRDRQMRFLRATPTILTLQAAWVAGETWGLVTGRT